MGVTLGPTLAVRDASDLTSTISTPCAPLAAMASSSDGPDFPASSDITLCDGTAAMPAEARRATIASSTAPRPPGSTFMRLITNILLMGGAVYLGSFQVS